VVVTIKPPQGHEARVVNCSSCGAPQEEGRTCCNFCGADFTLHERDLNTVCPTCMARISDRAKFCHHCGTRVAAESVAGEETQLACPACGESHFLSGRRVAEVPVLECGRCAGLWLGNDAFKQVSDRAAEGVVDVAEHFPPRQAAPAGAAIAVGQSQRYRKCPMCGQIMHRRNYARRSGVIVDVCREHGVWFDADELPRIIAWIRQGGLARSSREMAEEEAHRERLQKLERSTERAAWPHNDVHGGQFGLADVLVEAVFRLFS
jgi:Zn-finger nucleic acid-binding protein